MSANNVLILKKYKDRYYGFDMVAEKTGFFDYEFVDVNNAVIDSDTEENILHKANKLVGTDYFEYDYDWDLLPKDGVRVEVLESDEYKKIDEVDDMLYDRFVFSKLK